jgi:hypothetical protein
MFAKPEFHAKSNPALSEARNQQVKLIKELRRFKIKCNLDRSANYPTSIKLHFSLVAVMILIEALGNMYLFAQGNELGLLGGIFEAILLSVVNVGVAVLVGLLALPQLNLQLGVRRHLGLIALILAIVFSLVFNLAAAHYRDLLILSKEIALEKAIPNVINHTFDLSFNGLVLLALGVIVFALGLWKGYSADDPYPGYGALSRKSEAASQAFRELREKYPDAKYSFEGKED